MQAVQDRTSSAPERIVITAIGLTTPVGVTCWETLCAVLEGRSAYRSHETVQVLDDPDVPSLRGATISRVNEELIPSELGGSRRIAALLSPAVQECLGGLPPVLRGQVDWKIITAYAGCEEIMVEALAKKLPGIRLSSENIVNPQNPRSQFVGQLAHASKALLKRQTEAVAVACADSLCDTDRLRQLMLAGRLKDPDNPYGIMAGEAAGAVLLERESAARSRGAPIFAAFAASGNAVEPHPWPAGKPSKALGLTTAFHQAFGQLDDQGAGIAHVSADENGERPRALEWALTAGRIFPNPEKERFLWHPAVVTGDAGGAQGAIVLADALARLILGTPPTGRVALAVSDEQGGRQVLCLENVEQPERDELINDLRRRLGPGTQ